MQDFTKPQPGEERQPKKPAKNSKSQVVEQANEFPNPEKEKALQEKTKLLEQITATEHSIQQLEKAIYSIIDNAGGPNKISEVERLRIEKLESKVLALEDTLYELEDEVYRITPQPEKPPVNPNAYSIFAIIIAFFMGISFITHLVKNYSLSEKEFFIGAGLIIVYFLAAIRVKGLRIFLFNAAAMLLLIALCVFNYLPYSNYEHTVLQIQQNLIETGRFDKHKNLFYTKDLRNNPFLKDYLLGTSSLYQEAIVSEDADIPIDADIVDFALAPEESDLPVFFSQVTDNETFSNLALDTILIPNTQFKNSKFFTVSFEEITVNNTRFNNCVFNETTIANSSVTQTQFANSKFDNALFINIVFHSSLFEASFFTDSIFTNVSGIVQFPKNNFERSTLQDCFLIQPNFSKSNFSNATFLRSSLIQANFEKSTGSLIFDSVDLQNSSFQKANLDSFTLTSGTTLENCTFDNATINSFTFVFGDKTFVFDEQANPNQSADSAEAFTMMLSILSQAKGWHQADIPLYIYIDLIE